MTEEEVTGLAEVWSALGKGESLFLAMVDDVVLANAPEEEGDQRWVVKAFPHKESCQEYVKILSDAGLDAKVGRINLDNLYKLLPAIKEQVKSTIDCPVRIVLCGVDEDGHPVDRDTLHDDTVVLH